ncbi:MAG: hypothetical protein JXA91_01750 [Candidatus Thermoplasmatota archaeon]|nr:hypothetical protein [Candidatus Thermoplasmatota archaeon]
MQKKSVTFLVLIFSALLLNTIISNVASYEHKVNNFPFKPTDVVIVKSLNFLRKQQTEEGSIGSYFVSTWGAMAISSAEEDFSNWTNLVDYLENHTNYIDLTKATDLERLTMAIVSCDKDPRNFSGIDFVARIKDFFDGSQISGNSDILDDIFGILALISSGVKKDSSIIQTLCNYVKNKEYENGGWGNVDTTAVAIMALISSGEDKNSEIIEKAIAFIKTKQNENGGFELWGNTNTATTAWAVQAIVAVGENPTSIYWKKNGSCPIDYLLNLQQDDGSFNWSENNNMNSLWMTAYVIPALLGISYPIKIFENNESEGKDDSKESKNENQPSNQNDNNPKISNEDNNQPIELLTISKPIEGAIYVYNKEVKLPISGIFIIGQVEIIADANEDVEKVEFYLNNELKYTDYKSPFVWYFNEKGILSIKKITVKAYVYNDKILVDINSIITKIDSAMSHIYMEKTVNCVNYFIRYLKTYAETIENFIDRNCEFKEKEICIFNLFPQLH